MSQVGSFGVNYKKDFGLDPAVIEFRLGDVASNRLGSFVYIKASAAIDQYAFVAIDENGNAAMLTTTNAGTGEGTVGVVQVALSAHEFGFAWIGGAAGGGNGVIKGKVAASYVANAALYTTATAGVADDAVTTLIKNVVGLTTDSGSGSAVALYSSNFLTVK
jgi:hypothetical protein